MAGPITSGLTTQSVLTDNPPPNFNLLPAISDEQRLRSTSSPTPAVPPRQSHADDSSSELELHSRTPSSAPHKSRLSSSSSPEPDAEGSPELSDASIEHDEPNGDKADSASEGSSLLGKRKSPVDEDEYMRRDPELYGLRRSGRARMNNPVIESASDSDASDIDARPARKRRRPQHSREVSQGASSKPSPTPSDSSDIYNEARGRSSKAKQSRRQTQSQTSSLPPAAEIRFSTRRAAKVANYNEEDDEDEFEEEDDGTMLTPNYYTNGGYDENAPAVDAVLDHRLTETFVGTNPRKEDFDYYIKWVGHAHYHATWQPYASLSSLKGFKKLKNYFDKIIVPELDLERNENTSLEEKEQWNLERERRADALIEHTQIERVIDVQDGDGESEYFVKWKGLTYDCCTWESESVVRELSATAIDKFHQRASRSFVSDKIEGNPNSRRQYKPFYDQPGYIKGGELREFQIRGMNFLAHSWCKGDNVILADEMGLGKTIQTIAFMSWLIHERQQVGPFIVVVPLSTLPAWAETFDFWAPDIHYITYTGPLIARNVIREKEMFVDGNPRKVKFNVILTTFDYFNREDSHYFGQVKWQFLAVDEAHRLKNRDSQLYGKLFELGVPSRLLITGTPVQNNLTELASLMNFLMPGKVVLEEDIDLQSEAARQKLDGLVKAIEPYILRRTKQNVENDLPPKTEKLLRVELADHQTEWYKNILERNYAALNEGAGAQKQSFLNIMMELKKVSNHPFMIPSIEDRILAGSERSDYLRHVVTSSGKMMLLDQLLAKLKKDNHRVLIFSQMVKMLDILGEYMQFRGHQFQRLDGTISANQRRLAIDHFNAPDSNDFAFLLSTRAGGLGINLMTADTVIIFDSDWNPQADLQAMGRAHRIGQKKPVTVYRLVSKATIEEDILERARNKMILEFLTIQRGVTDKEKEYSDKLAKAGRAVNAPDSADEINRILKRRGQKMFEQAGNQKRLEELDIDDMIANAEELDTQQPESLTVDGGEEFLKCFEYTDVKVDLVWDDIIPPEKLEKIKAEEKRKEEERYLAKMIEQNAPRKRKGAHEEREQRAAKKRARDLAAADVYDEDDDDDEDSSAEKNDPKRPLSEKEIRNLHNAVIRFGSLEERADDIIKAAKLTSRDRDLLRATVDDMTNVAKDEIRKDDERQAARERDENKSLTKKDKKAVQFEYHGVKINANTLLDRPDEMRMVRDAVDSAEPDFKSFRIANASKPANYTCDWGTREDAMLCAGIARHGFGAWAQIRDDPDLGMGDKLFLEEHRVAQKEERNKGDEKNLRSPGAVHLVRRANYLLSVLKASQGADPAAKKALENHHRNNKKNKRLGIQQRTSPSPSPNTTSKHKRDVSKSGRPSHELGERHSSSSLHPHDAERRKQSKHSHHTKLANGTGSSSQIHHKRDSNSQQQRSSHKEARGDQINANPSQEFLRKYFHPLIEQLETLRASKHLENDKKLVVMKRSIKQVWPKIVRQGDHQLPYWEYLAANYWPGKDVRGDRLMSIAKKMIQKEADKDVVKPPEQQGTGNAAAADKSTSTTSGHTQQKKNVIDAKADGDKPSGKPTESSPRSAEAKEGQPTDAKHEPLVSRSATSLTPEISNMKALKRERGEDSLEHPLPKIPKHIHGDLSPNKVNGHISIPESRRPESNGTT